MFRHLYRGYILELTSVGVDVINPEDTVYLKNKISLEEAVMFVNREISKRQERLVDSGDRMP